MQISDVGALVTGGASGLGAATARRLAAAGAKVTVVDRSTEAAEAIVAEIGGMACTADVTDESAVEAAFAKAQDSFGVAPRIVIN